MVRRESDIDRAILRGDYCPDQIQANPRSQHGFGPERMCTRMRTEEPSKLQPQKDSTAPAVRKSSARGDFFAIDHQVWGAVCNLQRPLLAITYLVMATGSSGGNTRTKWSAEAVHSRSGMQWRDAKASIASLCDLGFIKSDPEAPRSRPRYSLPSFGEYERQRRQGKAASKDTLQLATFYRSGDSFLTKPQYKRLCETGFVRETKTGEYERWPENEPTLDGNKTWLPNSLINGAPGVDGPPPIMQFFHMGDVWTLRLLIDLYHVHFLDSCQGVDRRLMRYKYEPVKLGQQGLYNVWGFKPTGGEFFWHDGGPFAAHKLRVKAKDAQFHPVWDSLETLRRMRLLSFIPHLFTNNNPETTPLHALGAAWEGAEPEEVALRNAVVEAGEALLQPGQVDQAKNNDIHLIVPAPHYFTPMVYKTIRLTFRPHTSATARWYGDLKSTSPEWISRYEKLREEAAKASPALRDWEAWGT